MHHRLAVLGAAFALAFTLLLPACVDVDDPDDVGAAEAALISPNFTTRAAASEGMAVIGYRRNGVVLVKCSGAFLRNDWILTDARCVESVPWGSQLVASSNFDLDRPSTIAPAVADVQWVTVAGRSLLASNPELALVRLSQRVSTGIAGDPTATNGFTRPVAGTPVATGGAATCFGFSVDSRPGLRLGLFPVTFNQPRLVMVVAVGASIQAERTDDGGACFAGGVLVATMRFSDLATVELTDVGRRWQVAAEIAALIAGQPASVGRPWPITEASAVTGRCMTVRSTGDNLHTEPCLASWSQGFQQLLIRSGTSSDDVQLAHRGTGLCVEALPVGYVLRSCAAAGASGRWPQTFRVTYLADGSVQLFNPSTGFCMTELDWGAAGTVVWPAQCASAVAWFQGLGRN